MDKVKVFPGGIAADDRGYVSFVNDFNFAEVKRFYQVENHKQGFIRAWHGHRKEGKYIFVPKGAALIGAVPLDYFAEIDMPGVGPIPGSRLMEDPVFTTVLTSKKPTVVYIPPGYANGFKTLESDTIVQFFSTSTLEESLKDDVRFEWNRLNIWEEEYR